MLEAIQRRLAGRRPGEIITLVARNITEAARSLGPAAAAARRHDMAFDRRWGTETSGLVNLSSLAVDPLRARHGVRYQPSSSDALAYAVAAFGIAPEDWHFLDYGSGKGRVVLIAAGMGFATAAGVEFSPELCRTALENARIFTDNGGASRPPEFVLADAGSFDPPAGPLLAYLYNPFGPPVLDEVAERLSRKALQGDPVLVAYANPQHLDAFMSHGGWAVVRREPELALLRSL